MKMQTHNLAILQSFCSLRQHTRSRQSVATIGRRRRRRRRKSVTTLSMLDKQVQSGANEAQIWGEKKIERSVSYLRGAQRVRGKLELRSWCKQRTRQRSEDSKARSRYTTAKTPLPCQNGPNVHWVPGTGLPVGGVLRLRWGGSWDPRHLPTLYADPALHLFERASRDAYSPSGPTAIYKAPEFQSGRKQCTHVVVGFEC